jgi:hypothetical protein
MDSSAARQQLISNCSTEINQAINQLKSLLANSKQTVNKSGNFTLVF